MRGCCRPRWFEFRGPPLLAACSRLWLFGLAAGALGSSVGGTTSGGGGAGGAGGTTGLGGAGTGGAGGSAGVGTTSTDGSGSGDSGNTGSGGATSDSTSTGGSAGATMGGSPGLGGSAGAGIGDSTGTNTTTYGGTTSSGGASTGGGSGGTAGGPGVGEEPYCQRLHHLGATPVIDGTLDGNLPLQDLLKDAVRIPSDNPPEFSSLPGDVSMRFAAAWFDGGFYVFAEIVDPDRYPALASNDEWMGDGIDIYLDHDAVFDVPGSYDDPGTRSLAVSAPIDGSTPSTRGGVFMPFVDLGSWSGGECVAVPMAEGYRIEAVVTAATLGLSSWSPSAGAPFAFDVGHNVSFPAGESGSEGRRLGHYFARAAAGADGDFEDYPFYDSAVFCVPTLVDP